MTSEQITELLTGDWRGSLKAEIAKVLGKRHGHLVNDVLSEVALRVWAKREVIKHKTYIRRAARITALETVNKIARYVELDDVMKRQLISNALAPDARVTDESEQKYITARRKAIIARLTPACQRQFAEWQARGFVSVTRLQVLQSSRLRNKIARLSGAKPKNHRFGYIKKNQKVN